MTFLGDLGGLVSIICPECILFPSIHEAVSSHLWVSGLWRKSRASHSNSQFIRFLHPKCGRSVNLYKDSTKRSHDSKSISLNLFLGEFGSLDVSNEPTLYTGSTVKCHFKPGWNFSCRYNAQHPIQTSLKPPAATCIEYFSNLHKTCLRSWSACSFSTTQAYFC